MGGYHPADKVYQLHWGARGGENIHQDVVDGNVNDLDNVSDGSHYDETNTDGARDLKEFSLVGYTTNCQLAGQFQALG
jgi:hypothetical protein